MTSRYTEEKLPWVLMPWLGVGMERGERCTHTLVMAPIREDMQGTMEQDRMDQKDRVAF